VTSTSTGTTPRIVYPPELPITARRDDLAAAIRDHQVVIVAGETGSGKTTQLPKICLELGRGAGGRRTAGRGRDVGPAGGLIGHTQPRRIAARTIAGRIAEELDTPLGELVGWKVRFTDEVSDRTRIKLMTDGILLAELGRDRLLSQYDTLIIDEAHERSPNIAVGRDALAILAARRQPAERNSAGQMALHQASVEVLKTDDVLVADPQEDIVAVPEDGPAVLAIDLGRMNVVLELELVAAQVDSVGLEPSVVRGPGSGGAHGTILARGCSAVHRRGLPESDLRGVPVLVSLPR
jgi:energy-coupling factor transporter ATP-binding protein EcfA2